MALSKSRSLVSTITGRCGDLDFFHLVTVAESRLTCTRPPGPQQRDVVLLPDELLIARPNANDVLERIPLMEITSLDWGNGMSGMYPHTACTFGAEASC